MKVKCPVAGRELASIYTEVKVCSGFAGGSGKRGSSRGCRGNAADGRGLCHTPLLCPCPSLLLRSGCASLLLRHEAKPAKSRMSEESLPQQILVAVTFVYGNLLHIKGQSLQSSVADVRLFGLCAAQHATQPGCNLNADTCAWSNYYATWQQLVASVNAVYHLACITLCKLDVVPNLLMNASEPPSPSSARTQCWLS